MNRSEGDSYRPQYDTGPGPPPSLPPDAQDAMYHFQGNNNGNQPGRRRDRRRDDRQHNTSNRPPRQFRFRALPPSERPLMTQGHVQESSELTFGVDGAEDKFRNLDELTDTDETDMDVSVDDEYEDISNIDGRPSKRTRINEEGDAAESLPKWSNPDPYTALPPVDQDSRKKTNVVNLIRKARNTAAFGKKDISASHDDDFISFDFDDDGGASTSMAPLDAPLGPRLGRHEVVSSTLGKRSREDFESALLVTPKYGQQHHSDGRILQLWQADADCDPTPWVRNSITPTDSAGVALHKEIIDFYDWVQPKDYEVAVRGSVLDRLEQALLRLHPGGKLEAFGSYAAGLYLPVGDMDLVFLDRNFRPQAMSNGPPSKPHRRLFESTAKFIREQRIARPGSVNAIWFAKVPIIKFIENISGLKVDLSFNNATGVVANQTFHSWREVYPAMPIITSIIKQFLMIRGLNDVASGGLGGFSVICLVTSLIQHMPVTSQPANLGQTLVEFFNLYGKLFNRQQVAIRLDPPGYVDVANYQPFQFNNDKPDRLKIIDPNRPENNISGGTNKIGLVFNCFATAHDILQECLAAHEDGQTVSSFLEQIVGGNFEAYDTQREFLQELHIGPYDQQTAVVLPQPPPPTTTSRRQSDQFAPPPPSSTHQAQVPVRTRSVGSSNDSRGALMPRADGLLSTVVNGNRKTRETRSKTAVDGSADANLASMEVNQVVERIARLRPQLADRVDDATSMRELASIGGYGNVHVMQADLNKREAKQTPTVNGRSVKIPGSEGDESIIAWHRERARRFRPDLSAAIDRCTTKKQLATVCGGESPSKFFEGLGNWERSNGFGALITEQKAALNAAAAPAKKSKGLNNKKRSKKYT